MSRQTNESLLNQWIELWSGKLALAEEIIGPDFVAHFPSTVNNPNEVHGSQALKGWISQTLALFDAVQLSLEINPISDEDRVVGRWIFRGTYKGGIPGASSTPGTQVAFKGIDIVRIADEKIVEYWVSSDGSYLMQQLGVIAPLQAS